MDSGKRVSVEMLRGGRMRNIEDVIKHINKDFVTLRINNVKEPALSDLEMDAVILVRLLKLLHK